MNEMSATPKTATNVRTMIVRHALILARKRSSTTVPLIKHFVLMVIFCVTFAIQVTIANMTTVAKNVSKTKMIALTLTR